MACDEHEREMMNKNHEGLLLLLTIKPFFSCIQDKTTYPVNYPHRFVHVVLAISFFSLALQFTLNKYAAVESVGIKMMYSLCNA